MNTSPAMPRLIPTTASPYPAFAHQLLADLMESGGAAARDLSTHCILLPIGAPVAPLRQALSQAAGGALLGPTILTLAQFAERCSALDITPLSAFDCKLLLVDVLSHHRHPFPGQDVWQLAEALFDVFEALAAEATAPAASEAEFEGQLIRAYGTTPGAKPLMALSREARIVHQLWEAYRVATDDRSPAMAQANALRDACQRLHSEGFAGAIRQLHLLGYDTLNGSTRAALRPLLQRGQATLWLHGRLEGRDGAALRTLTQQLGLITPTPAPDGDSVETTSRSVFLDRALSGTPIDGPIPNPHLRLVAADSPEHEARCVELEVREALLAGERTIAIVTEDRRLARRLRALLERANLVLEDDIGWALSTSAAAAALNAWLDGLDSGFHFRPLLSLLKSAFMPTAPAVLTRLERDLVIKQEIESGLDQYLAKLNAPAASGRPALSAPLELSAANEGNAESDLVTPALHALLTTLAVGAASWPALDQPQPGDRWLAALLHSLDVIQLTPRFAQDDAGRVLLDTLRALHLAFINHPLPLRWPVFRAVLDRALEQATFRPERRDDDAPAATIRLLTLERSTGLHCDRLILAGATRALLPASGGGDPFFNQSVRAELGLPTLRARQNAALAQLRRVLEAAPQVLISYAAEAAGEPAQLSPWIEALESFSLSGKHALRDTELPQRAGTASVEISRFTADVATETRAPLASPTYAPAPRAPGSLLPHKLSASAHQRLIDCPYQFFACDVLGLRNESAPDEDPDRADYGERVHRILQRYTEHSPPPVDRAAAETLLRTLADEVFAPDLSSRALAQVWRAEFATAVPAWLDWLAERPAVTTRAEQPLSRELDERWTLTGFADRIEERNEDSHTIVDYKTGRQLPRSEDVLSGEAVQLTHYALLDERVDQVEYLSLSREQKAVSLEGEALQILRADVEARLCVLLDALTRWAPMPAHGDALTCSRCDYAGLCRKADWCDA